MSEAHHHQIHAGQTWECNEARANGESVPEPHTSVPLWPNYPRFSAVVDAVDGEVVQLSVGTSNSHPRSPDLGDRVDLHVDKLHEQDRWTLKSTLDRNDQTRRLMTDGIGQIADETTRIPFDSQFLEPIIRGEKDSTVRLERYDIEAGDHLILTNESGRVEWARVNVTHTFTSRALVADDILNKLEANHTLTEMDKDVAEVLQPHYSEPVKHSTTVQGICWNLLQRFAEAPTDGNEGGEE